uniref:Immunoglobulin domain-containing protein n=1 Tax=Anas platyrhynchos platyrhynchos TaxID=8840 RepID=A0A493TEE4_ANAPP
QPTTALHQLPSPSPLLVFAGLQAQTPGELSQREGSDLSVLCPYPAEREYRDLKSWCRWIDERCQVQVAIIDTRTVLYTEQARQGHITIQDDPIHRNFSITMTDLRVQDSGIYYCAYRKGWQDFVPLKTISLTVFKGEYLFPMQTPVLSGGNVTASSLHPPTAHSERLPPTPSISPLLHALALCFPCSQSTGYPDHARRWMPLCLRLRVRHQVCCSAEFHKVELDSLSVQCPYHTLGYRSERKAWCRAVSQTGRCDLVVSTDFPNTLNISKAQKGRASIQDDTQNRTV